MSNVKRGRITNWTDARRRGKVEKKGKKKKKKFPGGGDRAKIIFRTKKEKNEIFETGPGCVLAGV